MATEYDLDNTTGKTRFDSFNVHRGYYKQIRGHQIEVGVLVPKTLKPGKHPLLVKFHGGGLVTGTALYPDWFAAFFVPFVHRTSSIVVLPNYRLLPEHSGRDILEDLADFWKWFDGDGLTNLLLKKEPGLELSLDRERLCVSGDSAGGLMALHSALHLPNKRIRVVLAQYPMSNYLRREPTEKYGDHVAPGPEIIDKYIDAINPDAVVSSAIPPYRQELSYALAAYSRWQEFFGIGENLLPIDALDNATFFPPTFIIHSLQDTAVAVGDSENFVKKLKHRFGNDFVEQKVRLESPDGDHGFDIALKEKDTPWLKDGLQWVEKLWLE